MIFYICEDFNDDNVCSMCNNNYKYWELTKFNNLFNENYCFHCNKYTQIKINEETLSGTGFPNSNQDIDKMPIGKKSSIKKRKISKIKK